ncbi:hypothetical protein [Flavobacterium aestuarii]|uniref:hypothetical protein n=1 Tax=Flavobacterium aestuarii TaxID=3149227 RepID=UPI0032B615BD
MKNLLLCIATSLFFISCSTDSDFDISENGMNQPLVSNISVAPENKANPMDLKGKTFYKALTPYSGENKFPNSIDEITNQIKFVSAKIGSKSITSKRAIVFNDDIVQSIMADPDNIMISIVQSSSLGSASKTDLIAFLQDLISRRQQEFEDNYNFITTYENTVLLNQTFSADDKDTILTVTSISRYSLYSESERKDRDWETSVGSKMAKPFFKRNQVSIIYIIALLHQLI